MLPASFCSAFGAGLPFSSEPTKSTALPPIAFACLGVGDFALSEPSVCFTATLSTYSLILSLSLSSSDLIAVAIGAVVATTSGVTSSAGT